MKNLLFLFSFLFFSIECSGFDIDSVNPEKKIYYQGSILSIEKMKDENWLLEQLRNVNHFIREKPYSEKGYIIRGYLLQLLYENRKIPSEKVKVANLGIRYSAEGLKNIPGSINLKFWYTSFIGEKYLYLGVQMLKELPVVIHALKDVVKKDPECCLGLAAMMLGRYYYKIPPFPLSLGDFKKSKKYLEVAMKVNKNMVIYYMYLAETLYALGDKLGALRLLQLAKKVKPERWIELYLYQRNKPGIDILETSIRNDEWGPSKDIYMLMNKISH